MSFEEQQNENYVWKVSMSLIVAFLRPYLFQLILYGTVAAAVGGGFLFVKSHYENVGWNKAIAAVAAKDERAISRVKEATKTVDDCYAAGKQWDATVGVCT